MASFFLQTYIRPKIDQSAARQGRSTAALSSIWALCVHGRMRSGSVGTVPPPGRILPPSARHRGATIPVERGKDVLRSCKGEGSGGRACAHRAECLAAAPSCRPCSPPTYLGALGVAPAHPATSRISCAHSLLFHPPGQGGGVAVSACAPRCAPGAARVSQPPRFAVAAPCAAPALRSHRVPCTAARFAAAAPRAPRRSRNPGPRGFPASFAFFLDVVPGISFTAFGRPSTRAPVFGQSASAAGIVYGYDRPSAWCGRPR